MSKRFTETDKWSDPWFRKLSPVQKCLFVYCCENCNNAGFIEIDLEAWAFPISCSIKELEGAWQGLGRGFIVSKGWAFIRTFLKHQKHLPLNPERNPAHRQIVAFFNEQSDRFPGLLQSVLDGSPLLGAREGLDSPIGIGIGEGIGKGERGDARGECKQPKKSQFGEFGKVLLTEDEHGKLKISYGERLETAITVLDSYMASKGKKYASCYATMKKGGWVWDKAMVVAQSVSTRTPVKPSSLSTEENAILVALRNVVPQRELNDKTDEARKETSDMKTRLQELEAKAAQ